MCAESRSAVLSFLLWVTADLMLYAISTVGNATTMLLDPLLETIPGAIAGGAIALSLRKSRWHGRGVPAVHGPS